MSKIIETHAHLYAEELKEDICELIENAQLAGVEKFVMPNVDETSIDGMMELEAKHPGVCYSSMGLHPCYVKKDFEKQLYLVEDWLNKRKFVSVGEIGIDLHWDKTTLAWQEEALKIQLRLAAKHQLPVILHTRNAFKETYDLIKALALPELKGVFHCFSGTVEEAQDAIALGFQLGIGGVVTFKNGGLDKVVADLPIESLVLETDCPYLAPIPHRGKRNEPSFIAIVAHKVAEVKKLSVEEVIHTTTTNAKQLFYAL
ncbi:MAG: TatD family deoxyribonuclease [Cytophagaceae bacterium]|jgi:TatD DNase family protein|nr:TatD family deoxyribonuclease [Cytophagaceae bacterium]